MRKTLSVVVTLALVLTGCGFSTTDNSDVLEAVESLREDMNSGFAESNNHIDQLKAAIPQESASSKTASSDTEGTFEEETVPEQATATAETSSNGLQVYVINHNMMFPVKLTEGTLTSDCVSNPTDLDIHEGQYRDLEFIFLGEKVSQVNWVNGNTFENIEGLFPKATNDTLSHLHFHMENADGIYSFTAITESGRMYSFSIEYFNGDSIY